ncbi:hypothetical protein ACFX1R_002130 [Malus domestica]
MASIPPLQSSKFQKSRDPNPVPGPAFKCKSTVSIPGLGFGDQIDGAAIVLRGARRDGPCKALWTSLLQPFNLYRRPQRRRQNHPLPQHPLHLMRSSPLLQLPDFFQSVNLNSEPVQSRGRGTWLTTCLKASLHRLQTLLLLQLSLQL